MSSTPPPPPPPPPTTGYERQYYPMPPVPAPPAELIVFLLAWVVALIVTVAADSVGLAPVPDGHHADLGGLHHLARDRQGRQGLRAASSPLSGPHVGFPVASGRSSAYLLASDVEGAGC